MKNPILTGKGYQTYVLAWLVVMLAHIFLLHLYIGFSWQLAMTDALVYNVLFAVMAPGFWYVVNFAGYAKDTLATFAMHVGAAAISVLFWASTSTFPLRLLFDDSTYLSFLSGSYIWRVIIGLMYYSIIVLIYYQIKYYLDMSERVRQEGELRNLLQDAELRMLKSQINPHFIFNSLNSISALTIAAPELAQEMVIKLSGFLRYSLGKDSKEMNQLSEELENVGLYLEIEKIRFGDKLRFEIDVEEEAKTVKVPNLILQPIIENAIKYGLYESMEPVNIHLTSKLQDGFMEILVENDFDPDAVSPKGTGIGLKNVRKRLQLVYGKSDLLLVRKDLKRFKVTLKIPVKQ